MHACTNTIGSYSCSSCGKGYNYTGSNTCSGTLYNECTKYYTTVDINECNTNNGGCSDTCINTNGGYYCVGMYCIQPHIICISPEVGRGALRLFRNGLTYTGYTAGIVQIYYSNTWGNICDDSDFTSAEAIVICHQLGYSGYITYGPSGTISRFVCSLKLCKLYFV